MSEEKISGEPCGVLIINKPTGPTSHDIVGMVRRLYNTRRVGHTGTLDPLAAGVLPVLVGRAAKAAEYLCTDNKRYMATLTLGITTDTEDITGAVLTQSSAIPDEGAVREVCARFIGKIMQTPPMYSAKKVGGQKLVDLARRGVSIERAAQEIEIYSLEVERESRENYRLDVRCSKGTYIRTLCADIGAALGCGGVMSTLTRTESGGFSLAQAITTEELQAMDGSARLDVLAPVDSLFASCPSVCLPEFYERLARNGAEIYQSKIGTEYALDARLRVCGEGGDFFALGEVRDYPQGSAIKTIKLFDI